MKRWPAQMLMVGMGLFLSALMAETQTPPPDKPKPAAADKAKPVTITVKVLVAQAVGTAPVPTPKVVIVRVDGDADQSSETNEKGIAKLSGMAAEKVKLHVMPPGVDLCQPPEFVVGTGNRVVEVQVEKWAAAQCKLKVLE